MDDSSKIIVKIEYEYLGMRKVFYGEIDSIKVAQINNENERFICIEKDGKSLPIDKNSIVSIEELSMDTKLYERSPTSSISQEQDAQT